MSDDLVQLAGRVQRIERRLKLGAGVLAAVLVAVATVAAVLSEQVPEVIEARAFRVLDEEGNVIWSAPEQVPEVTWKRIVAREFLVLDELGERRAYLGPGGLEFFDEQGTRRIALYADGQWAGQLAFLDEEGAVIEILPR